jgi:hypothetical protein
MGIQAVMKILNHPQFKKYTMWFMTETISPEAGQIAPALAHFGQQTTTSPHRPENWLTIYGAYLCSKCTVSFCYLNQEIEVRSNIIGRLYVC